MTGIIAEIFIKIVTKLLELPQGSNNRHLVNLYSRFTKISSIFISFITRRDIKIKGVMKTTLKNSQDKS